MGQRWSGQASQQTEKNELLAAALSAAFDEKVVTKEEYDRRKDEPEFGTVESLDIRFFEKLCYEPVKGQYGDVFGENGKPITVILKTLTGQSFKLSVGDRSYVEELKFLFEEQQRIPVDHSRLFFTFKGKALQDGFRISDYEIVDNSEISLMLDLKASAGRVLVLDPDLLSPALDCDFKNIRDNGTRYERGGHTYSRPYGWTRLALNVNGKYDDDIWLGERGSRTDSTPGEWPVSFHGTAKENVGGIARQGYLLSQSKNNKYGRGIYSSPSIAVAECYARKFRRYGKKYKVVIQNRVKSDELKVIPAEASSTHHPNVPGDYWLQPHDHYIRPYGVCIKEY